MLITRSYKAKVHISSYILHPRLINTSKLHSQNDEQKRVKKYKPEIHLANAVEKRKESKL